MNATLEASPPAETASNPEVLAREVVSMAQRLENPADTLHIEFRETVGVQTTPLQETNRVPMGGHRLLLKNETVHPCEAYKIRGMASALLAAKEQNPSVKKSHTGSAGNAALGQAEVANVLGMESIAHVKSTASAVKKQDLRMRGTKVEDTYDNLPAALEGAKRAATDDEDAVFTHPYDQIEVMAGQATVMQETLQQLTEQGYNLLHDEVDIVVAGGGLGLAAGSAAWLAHQKHIGNVGQGVRLTVAEVVRHTDEGKMDKSQLPWCDGTATTDGHKTRAVLDHCADHVDFVEVTETEVAQAMHELTAALGKRVEPAGALATAASKKLAAQTPKSWLNESGQMEYSQPGTYVAVVSGANVSDETYARSKELRQLEYDKRMATLGSLVASSFELSSSAGTISRKLRVASGK